MVVVFSQTIDGTPYDFSSTVRIRAVIIENRDADLTIRSLRVAAGAGDNLILGGGGAVGAGPSAGGQVQINGGAPVGAAAGGNVVLTGGAGTATGTAGSVTIAPGAPNGGTRGGITIGNANTGAITLGDGAANGAMNIVTGSSISIASGGGTNISINAGSSLIFSNANGATQVIPNADKALLFGSSSNRWNAFRDAWLHHLEDFDGATALTDTPKYENSGGSVAAAIAASPLFGGLVELNANGLDNNTSGFRSKNTSYFRDTVGTTNYRTIIEFIVVPRTVVTDAAFLVGLSDQLLNPSAAGNGVFARYDTDVPDAGWKLVGVSGGANTVSAATAAAPANGTYQRITIDVAANGSATLYVNGTAGPTIAAASVGNAPMRSLGLAITREAAGASRVLQVDKVEIWSDRQV